MLKIWLQRYYSLVLVGIAVVLAIFFITYSSRLTKELSNQEKERMELWAEATRELISPDPDPINFPLDVIEKNTNIPVVLTDSNGVVLSIRNIDVTELPKSEKEINRIIRTGEQITLNFPDGNRQYIYYRDSTLLRKLTFYPWVELTIIIAFFIIVIVAINSIKKMEQNRLWVGLTKETAHQLGTPISSLQGWTDFLIARDGSTEVLAEMKKDLTRLNQVVERFSKVGMNPSLEIADVTEVVENTVNYMRTRASGRVSIVFEKGSEEYIARISEPLFQWVLENLMRNAIDAMKGSGVITVSIRRLKGKIEILVKDTGCGIARKYWKRIFSAGFTTKPRGWGVGLTLTKRIIEEYHAGKIEVAESILKNGTTFRILLPEAGPLNKPEDEIVNIKKK